MNTNKYLAFFLVLLLLGGCGKADFTGPSGMETKEPETCQSTEQATSVTTNAGLNCASAVVARGISPNCSIIATRENATSTRCNVFVASTGGAMSEDPSITGSQALTKKDKGWTSQVECAPEGETITANVKNISLSAECSATVAEIPAPACTLTTNLASIEIGQTVDVIMGSAGGPETSATMNYLPIAIDKAVTFTPTVAGTFVINGVITNPRSSANCVATVSVKAKSVPLTVAPSCSMVASRINSTSLQCNVSIGSTGGPIANPPSLAGVIFTSAGINKWTATSACAASGATLNASVTNAAGTRACAAVVPAIEKPACKLTTNVSSIDLGQDVSVTLQSTGGPMVTAEVNGRPVTAGGSVNLKPTAAGIFTMTGTINNPSATATCSTTVSVKTLPPAPITQSAKFRFGKQAAPLIADYLFVMDNSVSMQDDIDKVAAGLSAISRDKFPAETQIGVMTTMAAVNPVAVSLTAHADINRAGYGACIDKEPGFLSLVTSTSVQAFKSCPNVPANYAKKYSEPACDSGWFKPFDLNSNGKRCFTAALQNPQHTVGCEPGLLALEQIIKRYQQQGQSLFRDNAAVNIVFVSDEQGGCAAPETRGNRSDPAGALTRIESAIKTNSKVASVKVHGITPSTTATVDIIPLNVLPYKLVIDKSLGKWFNILLGTNDYSSIMEQIISAPADITSADFFLPVKATAIAGVEVNGIATMNYKFDGTTKVSITGLDPQKVVDIVIRYK
jgi:hypothetical protein